LLKVALNSIIITPIQIDSHVYLPSSTMLVNSAFDGVAEQTSESVGAVLLMPGENHRPVANHWQTYHIMLYLVHLVWVRLELTTSELIGTDCKGSCKFNYFMITTTMVLYANTDTFIWVINMYLYFGLVFFFHDKYTRKRIMLKKHK
jgi:hypothetical protein